MQEAVEKIFKVKKRPNDNPLIVHLSRAEEISKVADTSDALVTKRLKLLESLWPGPLSVVLDKLEHVPDNVSAGLPSIAVRVPDNPIALKLLKLSGVPIAAPSANISGYISPTKAEHVMELANEVDYILTGDDCKIGLESTVLDIRNEKPAILRPGHYSRKYLSEILKEEVTLLSENSKTLSASPGTRHTHYCPTVPLIPVSYTHLTLPTTPSV